MEQNIGILDCEICITRTIRAYLYGPGPSKGLLTKDSQRVKGPPSVLRFLDTDDRKMLPGFGILYIIPVPLKTLYEQRKSRGENSIRTTRKGSQRTFQQVPTILIFRTSILAHAIVLH